MNLKLKAGVIVAGIVAGSMALSGALKLVAPYITPEIAFNIVMFASLAILLYTMYNLVLTNLETSKKYQDMVDRKLK